MTRARLLRSLGVAATAVLFVGEAHPSLPRTLPDTAPGYIAMAADPVDLSTGLYVRNTVDLVLFDEVPVVFERTYRNRDSRSRPFGVGTNHSFGTFLAGDYRRFSYVDLVLPDGGRIHFVRTSPGTSYVGSVFVHDSSPSKWRNSRLYWNGNGWTIDLEDGARYTYPSCAAGSMTPCTVSSYRDKDGHLLRMRHDARMNLRRVETTHGLAIDFTYDRHDRIVLARTTDGQQVAYRYDERGRLIHVTAVDGSVTEYYYDDDHQMVGIEWPGLLITNRFDRGGRAIEQRQQTAVVDQFGRMLTDEDVFTFHYTLDATGRIRETVVDEPNGVKRSLTFNERGYSVSEKFESPRGVELTRVSPRDRRTQLMQGISVQCSNGDKRYSVVTQVDPDADVKDIERQLADACLTGLLPR